MMLREPYGISELGLGKIFPENLLVAKEIIEDLERLKKSALQAGFSLKVESAFRSFEKQLSIWNRKAFGELPLLDKNGEVIQKLPENETEMMYCILFCFKIIFFDFSNSSISSLIKKIEKYTWI